jgi:hypothetical protein
VRLRRVCSPGRRTHPAVCPGDATNAVQVGSIAISPDPPVPGKDLTVTMTGTARNDIAVRCEWARGHPRS